MEYTHVVFDAQLPTELPDLDELIAAVRPRMERVRDEQLVDDARRLAFFGGAR